MNECAGAGSFVPTDPQLIVANPTPVYIAPYGEFPNSIAPAYPTVASQDWIFSPPEEKIPDELKRSLNGEALQPTTAQLEQQEYNQNPPNDPCRESVPPEPQTTTAARKAPAAPDPVKNTPSRGGYLDLMYEGVKTDFRKSSFSFTESPNEIIAEGLSVRRIQEPGPDGPVTKALVFVIDGNVSFATGSAQLTPVALSIVEKIGRAMNAYPETEAAVSGHTDSRGSRALNLRLSEQRARSVADTLIKSHSVSADRIKEVKGFADDRKVVDTMDAEPRNRRVEVMLTPAER